MGRTGLSVGEVVANLAPLGNVKLSAANPPSAVAEPVGGPSPSTGSTSSTRARAWDAIHTYLMEIGGYDSDLVSPAFYKAVGTLEALAKHLGDKARAEQDIP